MLKLIIEDDEGRKTVVPFVRDEITIGRQEGNTIRLTERNVSRRHARLLRQAGAVKIEDLGSSNGIRVNGDRISGLVQVSDGDLIQIGDYDLAIQREEERQAAAAATTPMQLPSMRNGSNGSAAPTARLERLEPRENAPTVPALPAVEPVSDETPPPHLREPERESEDEAAPPVHQSTAVIRIDQVQSNRRELVELDSTQAARLVVVNTEFAGREFLISKNETRIGRVDDNDVYLDHRSLSRTHCKLVREDNGEWRVIDMQSANGLMVNGEPYAQVTLRSGDVIELGHVKMRFVGPGDTAEAPTAATTVDTGEFEEVKGSSKAPVIAIIATVLVLALGGGGYAVLRHRTSVVEPTPPIKAPPVAVEPKVPTPVADPDPSDPEAGKKALVEAQKALDAMDLAGAEAALKACTITNGGPCPETAPMQALITAEKHNEASLKAADSALERQDTTTARAMLDAAAGSKVFESRVAALEAKYKTVTAAAAASAAAAAAAAAAVLKKNPVVPPPPGPAVPAAGVTATLERLATEARALNKDGQSLQAIEKLKQCLKLDANNLACIRLRGSAHAKLAADGSPDDKKKAREYYELYLNVAPPDDRYRDQIRKILDDAQ